MSAMADKIMKRVRAKGRGWVFTPKHFIDFGTRGSVDMALSRLAQAGEIRSRWSAKQSSSTSARGSLAPITSASIWWNWR